MAPKAAGVLRTARGEVLRVKSPAEFFSENKNIAGFDNPGKSLYTTIRELVENSLDACEAAGVLPDIEVTLHEIDKPALDKLVGITTHERLDTTLFEKASKEAKKRSGGGGSSAADGDGDGGKGKQETLYYKVMVRDNGCGMPHNTIPDSLGRVLAGSKYGVRQTRGKFGLGAKMALIWSKQSTGLPVEVRSATGPDKLLSVCVLDIDIRQNEPKTKLFEQARTCALPRPPHARPPCHPPLPRPVPSPRPPHPARPAHTPHPPRPPRRALHGPPPPTHTTAGAQHQPRAGHRDLLRRGRQLVQVPLVYRAVHAADRRHHAVRTLQAERAPGGRQRLEPTHAVAAAVPTRQPSHEAQRYGVGCHASTSTLSQRRRAQAPQPTHTRACPLTAPHRPPTASHRLLTAPLTAPHRLLRWVRARPSC
jgi:hypothetical protein